MNRPSVVAYTQDQHERIQLGLRAERPADQPTVLRVAVTANLVATNAKPLRTIALDGIAEGRTTIELDLSHCADADRRGLEALLSMHKAAKRAGGSLTLCAMQPDFRALLDAHGITNLFTVRDEATP
jgi:anti-anti-sigma regulatory factor